MITDQQITQARNEDLVHLVEHALGPGKHSGRWTMFKCPFHQDSDPSLAVTNGEGEKPPFWQCFGCGEKGDPIAWQMRYYQQDFIGAVQALAMHSPPAERAAQEPGCPEPDYPPGLLWQKRALEVIHRAQENLWSRKWAFEGIDWARRDPVSGDQSTVRMSALDWLLSRGLTEDTLRLWKIGYVPQVDGRDWQDRPENWGRKGKVVWMPQGILIPCIVADQVWYIKIRRPSGNPKYTQVPGGRPALYLVQSLEWQLKAVMCEGELDALLLHQEVGDLVGVATLGSATNPLNLATWGLHLLGIFHWFLAYDADKAGQEAASRLAWLRNCRQLQVPQLRKYDKDLTDFFAAGGDLRHWLLEELGRGILNPSLEGRSADDGSGP